MTTLDPRFAQLLSHLHRGGSYAYWWDATEARDKAGQTLEKRTTWWPVGQPAALPSPNGKGPIHIFFGVHPVKAIPTVRKNGKTGEIYTADPQRVRPRLPEIAAMNGLFGEFDAPPGDLPCPANVTIETSPGKSHLYWLFNEPFILDTPLKLEQAKRELRRH